MLPDLEAVSRLTSVREIVVHERNALDTLNNPRLRAVLDLMDRLEEEIDWLDARVARAARARELDSHSSKLRGQRPGCYGTDHQGAGEQLPIRASADGRAGGPRTVHRTN